ncbi:unnamed protein product [Cylicocyclus nassatus]|uniref:Uncharacterized protein n=1 Tax=Cylicocyclus nassatus TaxID=53992 RepID=A0AA36M9A8_CYLNA|nr:unnamed protein product [Cylicocyclus nassatus]
MFADLWDKHGIEKLFTINLAEAYHRQLNTLVEADYTLLGELIGVFRNPDSEAESALTTLKQNPAHVIRPGRGPGKAKKYSFRDEKVLQKTLRFHRQ